MMIFNNFIGNTLWLHPVSSKKNLESIKVTVIEDCIRRDLVECNYGVLYPDHLINLTQLFQQCNFPTPKVEKEKSKNETKSSILTSVSPTNASYSTIQPTYAFLDKEAECNLVFVSALTTHNNIYLQKVKLVYDLTIFKQRYWEIHWKKPGKWRVFRTKELA